MIEGYEKVTNVNDLTVNEKGFVNGIRRLFNIVEEDPDREGLKDTPLRVLNAMYEMLSGSLAKDDEIAKMLKTFKSDTSDEMVVVTDIEFTSMCEHHMLPFQGVAHVGYLPGSCIVGLSKIPRLVDVYAKRLQVQERMTTQIADALMKHLEPKGVGVVTTASHLCCGARGVKKPGVKMTCSALKGAFKESPSTRAEFLQFIGSKP